MLVEDWQVGLVAVAEVQLVELMNSISLREEVGVGVAEHAAVVPYGGAPLAAGALLADVLGGGIEAVQFWHSLGRASPRHSERP